MCNASLWQTFFVNRWFEKNWKDMTKVLPDLWQKYTIWKWHFSKQTCQFSNFCTNLICNENNCYILMAKFESISLWEKSNLTEYSRGFLIHHGFFCYRSMAKFSHSPFSQGRKFRLWPANPAHSPQKWGEWAGLEGCLAGSSKTAPRILIFSILMDADYSSKPKSMPIGVLAFCAYNHFCIGRVFWHFQHDLRISLTSLA